jgi:hypothetical protein
MHGLPMAGKLAKYLLKKRLREDDHHPCQFTPGLLKHVWRPVAFTLDMDEFGVKFVSKNNANHLVNTLKKHYKITEYCSRNKLA